MMRDTEVVNINEHKINYCLEGIVSSETKRLELKSDNILLTNEILKISRIPHKVMTSIYPLHNLSNLNVNSDFFNANNSAKKSPNLNLTWLALKINQSIFNFPPKNYSNLLFLCVKSLTANY